MESESWQDTHGYSYIIVVSANFAVPTLTTRPILEGLVPLTSNANHDILQPPGTLGRDHSREVLHVLVDIETSKQLQVACRDGRLRIREVYSWVIKSQLQDSPG